MVKGVNKAVIEINNTENPYIEKAILFVNPRYIEKGSRQINNVAKGYLKGLTLPDYCKPNNSGKTRRRINLTKGLCVISLMMTALFVVLLIVR